MVTAGVIFGTAGAAFAAGEISYVGGGTWYHGFEGDTVVSNYYHSSVCHGSTAVGTTTVRDSASAGNWSYASARRANSGNQTHWRTTC